MSAFAVVTRKLNDLVRSHRLIGILILCVGVLLAAIAAHIYLGSSANVYTGPIEVLDHIFDVALALCLVIVTLLIGFSVAKKFGLTFANTPEHLSFSLFLGVGLIGLSVLFFGLLGLLRPGPIVAFLIVVLALTYRELPTLYRVIKSGILSVTITSQGRILVAIFICLATLLLLRATSPPHAPDELIYHLPIPKEFVENGRISASYDNSLGNIPLLIHMLYVLCLMAQSDVAARIFSLTLAIATGAALYGFCARFLTRRIGAVALFAFFASGMVVEVAVTTRIDVSLAGMLFMATYAMINYLDTDDRRWFWTSAVLAGFSLGIKHSAGFWLLFVGMMYLIERLFRKRENFTLVVKRGIGYIFIAAALASPWYIKNYIWFNNPVYPFFTGEVADFGSQHVRYFNADDERRLDAHFEHAKREIPDIVDQQEHELINATHNRVQRHPMRLWEFFTRPNAYLMAEPYHYPNYLFLLSPLVLFLKPSRWMKWLAAISLAFALSATWSSWIARYLLPVYPALTIISAFTLVGLSEKLRPGSFFSQRLLVWLVAISLGSSVLFSVAWVRQFHSIGFLAGAISRHQFLRQFPDEARLDFIDNQLPHNARIMTIGSMTNYGIRRQYTSDETWFATKWRRVLARNDSLEAANQDLKRQGFSHILYCPSLFTFAATMGVKGTGGMDLLLSDVQRLSNGKRNLGSEYQLLRNWSTFTLYRNQFLESVYSDESECEILKIK